MTPTKKRRWKIAAGVLLGAALVSALSFAFVLYRDRTYVSSQAYERSGEGRARVLVVYYSRSGNTEGVAREVARHFDADILRIEAPRYSLDYPGWRHAANDADDEVTRTPIEHEAVNLEDYDLIALGSPIWWYRPSPPLWTFVEDNDFAGRRVILFNTFNSRFEREHIDRFQRTVEASGGVFLDHLYVRRGRVVWQKTPDEVRAEIRAALEARFPGGRVP